MRKRRSEQQLTQNSSKRSKHSDESATPQQQEEEAAQALVSLHQNTRPNPQDDEPATDIETPGSIIRDLQTSVSTTSESLTRRSLESETSNHFLKTLAAHITKLCMLADSENEDGFIESASQFLSIYKYTMSPEVNLVFDWLIFKLLILYEMPLTPQLIYSIRSKTTNKNNSVVRLNLSSFKMLCDTLTELSLIEINGVVFFNKKDLVSLLLSDQARFEHFTYLLKNKDSFEMLATQVEYNSSYKFCNALNNKLFCAKLNTLLRRHSSRQKKLTQTALFSDSKKPSDTSKLVVANRP